MNYIVIKQECKGYLQRQKDRRISFGRLLKMAKQRHLYHMTTAVWRKGCICCSFSYSNFLVSNIIKYILFLPKNCTGAFFLVLFIKYCLYFVNKISFKYVADLNNQIPILVTKLHKKYKNIMHSTLLTKT